MTNPTSPRRRIPPPDHRPPPPPLVARCPDCPICNKEVIASPSGLFFCQDCGCTWPREDIGHAVGEWPRPFEEQCPETVQPQLDNDWVTDPEVKNRTYRCLLDAGHHGDHADPEMTCFARGWR